LLHKPFSLQNTTHPVRLVRLGLLRETFGQRAVARHPRSCRTPFPAKDRTLRLSVSFLPWMGLRAVDTGSDPSLERTCLSARPRSIIPLSKDHDPIFRNITHPSGKEWKTLSGSLDLYRWTGDQPGGSTSRRRWPCWLHSEVMWTYPLFSHYWALSFTALYRRSETTFL